MSNHEQDIAAFIAKYSTPYDPETDTYRRAPFAEPIKAGKNTAIYNAHSYHTKVPPQGIVPYIEHYTEPGDLVIDPFCGSGMTGVASLTSGRNVVINDLSPAAAHIAYNYCDPVDVVLLKREFDRIKANIADEFDWLYGTVCDRCAGKATIQYTVWSDVYECERCGKELVLWDVAVDRSQNQVLEQIKCPVCSAVARKTQLRWLRSVPVLTNYLCQQCSPKRSEHDTTEAEISRIHEISSLDIPYWYPTHPFRETDWEMWRGVHRDQGITDLSRFFRPQNLWALSRLWHEVELVDDAAIREKLRFALTGSMSQISKMTIFMLDGSGRGHRKGTLYVPSFGIEQNVLGVVERRLKRIIDYCKGTSFSGQFSVSVGSAAGLVGVPDSSIDYVFTDPPFGSNIFYADCNLLWEAWLDRGFTDQTQEAVVHVKHKSMNTILDYSRLMSDAFKEMFRILKPGRWASVVFHNSDERIWQTILEAIETSGFELVEINAFDKAHLSFKGIRGQQGLERVTNKDLVLNLLKPGPGQQKSTTDAEYTDTQERRVVEAIADFLDNSPPMEDRTLQGIWNHALDRMLRDGSVQINMAAVGEMLPYYFKEVDGRWYMRGDAVAGGNVFDLKHDSGALAWLNSILGNDPQTAGELIPRWQTETAHLGVTDPGRLDRLLRENFWEDKRTGRWRIPTPDERTKMSARQSLADEAHLRTVRRFLDGKLDERINDWKLFEWARFCYEKEAFSEALALAQQINTSRLSAEQAQLLRRLVSVCRQRVGTAG